MKVFMLKFLYDVGGRLRNPPYSYKISAVAHFLLKTTSEKVAVFMEFNH